ncbi:MAG: PKD domain-containing protein [Myxococcota bacterium]
MPMRGVVVGARVVMARILVVGVLVACDVAPEARLSVPRVVTLGESVMADGSGSRSPRGAIRSYAWDFGDGTPTLITASSLHLHRYREVGSYDVTLTVEDEMGAAAATTTLLEVVDTFASPDGGTVGSSTSSGGSSSSSSGSASTSSSTGTSSSTSSSSSSSSSSGGLLPDVGACATAPDSLSVDLVATGDTGFMPDNLRDGAMRVDVTGPAVALILITTDADGTAQFGQEWDTLVRDQPIPPEIGAGFSRGDNTWGLGVAEGDTWLTTENGELIPLSNTVHALTLYGNDSGFFREGIHFRVVGLFGDGLVVWGPVCTYVAP